MPISPRTHHLPFVRNGFSDSAQNFGLGTTLKPFGLRRLNKSARALGPVRQTHETDYLSGGGNKRSNSGNVWLITIDQVRYCTTKKVSFSTRDNLL